MIYLFFVIVFICLLYIFLIFPRTIKKPSREQLMKHLYAHRGLFDNSSLAPENSLAAFKLAVENGYGIELDVQLSKDNIPVVFHDATLSRMCGVNGNVWDYTLKELKGFRLKDSDEQIPTFEEALKVIDGQCPIIVEYKLDRVQTKVCELSNELLEKYNGPYCIESFHPLAVLWYKKHRPDVVRGQLSKKFWLDDDKKYHGIIYYIMSFLLTNVATRPDFIAYKHSDASNISRRLCRLFGALSVAWTIKSQKDYEKAKDKFDLFIFDSCIL